MGSRRVVVTGLGLVTPLGTGVEKNWRAICKGQSGVDRISRFDTSDLPCRIAAEVRDFDPESFIEKKIIRTMDPFIQYAVAASVMAVEDSRLEITDENAERVGVVVGTGMGGLQTTETALSVLRERGPSRISPFHVPMIIGNLAPGHIAIRFGIKGPNLCIVTACTSGTHCIGHGFRLIRQGLADAILAGGTEACITRLSIAGFCAMRALSCRNEEPDRACRPFENSRDGFVMGEGSGIVVLEELSHAIRRGARIHAEVIGYGENGDAYHIVSPSPGGAGAAACMRLALTDAGIDPSEVDYINAHGTGTVYNDRTETLAIKSVFGEHAGRLAVSSTKSMTGHMLGAAGAVESVYTILALREGALPPTINYETPDPECDLDYVPNKARQLKIRVAMKNSFGFGGTNGVVIFKEFNDR